MRTLLAFVLLATGAPAALAQTFDATEYGYVASPDVDNTPAIQRLVGAALAGRRPGQIATLRFPGGVGGWQGEIRIEADSLEMVGCGGAVITRDTLASGAFYYPVRQADRVDPSRCVTVLRVMDGAQGRAQRSMRGEHVTRISLRNDAREPDRSVRRAHYFGLRHLVLDGNEAGQLEAVRGHIAAGLAEDLYRNAPGHTGINATRNGGGDFSADGPTTDTIGNGRTITRQGSQAGLLVLVDHVVVRGFAATGLVADRASRWTLNVVRLQDAAYNHIAYNVDGGVYREDLGPRSGWGGWTDVTVAGHAWGYVISDAGLVVTRLVAEEPTPSPLGRDAADVINARSGPVTVHGYTPAPAAAWPRLFNNTGQDETTVEADGPPTVDWLPTVVPRPAGRP